MPILNSHGVEPRINKFWYVVQIQSFISLPKTHLRLQSTWHCCRMRYDHKLIDALAIAFACIRIKIQHLRLMKTNFKIYIDTSGAFRENVVALFVVLSGRLIGISLEEQQIRLCSCGIIERLSIRSTGSKVWVWIESLKNCMRFRIEKAGSLMNESIVFTCGQSRSRADIAPVCLHDCVIQTICCLQSCDWVLKTYESYAPLQCSGVQELRAIFEELSVCEYETFLMRTFFCASYCHLIPLFSSIRSILSSLLLATSVRSFYRLRLAWHRILHV